MAVNEQIVTGKKFRICIDVANKLWKRISFWTKASDVEFNDGKTAEEKLGAINGITSEFTCEDESIAASMPSIANLLTANNKNFYFDYQDGKYGYNTDPNRGADTFSPFNSGCNIFLGSKESALKVNNKKAEIEIDGMGSVLIDELENLKDLSTNDIEKPLDSPDITFKPKVDWTKIHGVYAYCVVTSNGSCGELVIYRPYVHKISLGVGEIATEIHYSYDDYSWHNSNGSTKITHEELFPNHWSVTSEGNLKLKLYNWKGANGATNLKDIIVIYS